MVLFSDSQAGLHRLWIITGFAHREVGCFLHTSYLFQEPSDDYDTATLWTCDLELQEFKESLIHLKSAILYLTVVLLPWCM